METIISSICLAFLCRYSRSWDLGGVPEIATSLSKMLPQPR
jgi:hypothetical protein